MSDMLTICVKPHNNIFEQLRNNKATFISLIGELVDNSIAGNATVINIAVCGNWSNGSLKLETGKIVVEDNGDGIPFDKLGEALSPAALAKKDCNSLNEHGLGLKTAITSLGGYSDEELYRGFSICTKVRGGQTYEVDSLGWGNLDVKRLSDSAIKEHGTVVKIEKLKAKVYKRKEDYTSNVVPWMGATYQMFLDGTLAGQRVLINLELRDQKGQVISDSKGQLAKWKIEPICASYEHNKPWVHKVIDGKNYSAKLKWGPCPTKAEYQNANMEEPKRSHPYYPLNNKVDIFSHNKLLTQVEYKDLGIFLETDSIDRAFRGQGVRCQLFLEKGFATTFTKDGPQQDDNFSSLKEEIDKILSGHLKQQRGKPGEETLMVEQLIEQLDSMGLHPQPKYKIEGTGLEADLVVENKEDGKHIWEMKVGEAGSDDVAQLLVYILFAGDGISKTKGRLVAASFTDTAKSFLEEIKKKFGITIELVDRDKLRV